MLKKINYKNIIYHFIFIGVLILNLNKNFIEVSTEYMIIILALSSIFTFYITQLVFREYYYQSIKFTLTFIFLQPIKYILLYANYYQYSMLCDGEKYITGLTSSDYLYFSIVTWTTLGYGDMRPPVEARLLASIEGYLGYIFGGLIIAAFLKLLNRIDIAKYRQ